MNFLTLSSVENSALKLTGHIPKILSGYKDIASFLGVSTKTIQRHIKSLPVTWFGKRAVILNIDLIFWLRKNAQKLKTQKKSPYSRQMRS